MNRGGYFNGELVGIEGEWSCSGRYLLVDQGQVDLSDLSVYPSRCKVEPGMKNMVDYLSEDTLMDIWLELQDRMADRVNLSFKETG